MAEEEKKLLRYRIIYGYGKSEYIAIDETDLERAFYAWTTGAIFNHPSKSRKGTEFKGIEADFRFYTGWSDEHEPRSEGDRNQMTNSMPPRELFYNRKQLAENRARYIIENQATHLLSDPKAVDTLLLN